MFHLELMHNETEIMNYELFPGDETSEQKYIKDESVDHIYGKIDYALPINETSRFESGAKVSHRNYNNVFASSNFNQITLLFDPIDYFTSKINYKENIYALYANYSKQYEKFSYK